MKTILAAAVVALSAAGAQGQETSLTWVSEGAMPKIGGYRPQRLTLSGERPATLRNAPKDLKAPMYGALTMGAAGGTRTFHIVLDEPDGEAARLWVDANGNGDVTDDPPAEWKGRKVKGQDEKEYTQYSGGATVTLVYGNDSSPAHIAMYRFDKTDPRRASSKDVLMYYADYAYEGQMKFGDDTRRVMLVDDLTSGDFRGKEAGASSGVRLLVDVNGNKKFESRGEAFDVRQPFNIGGQTYEITQMRPSGAEFRLIRSSKKIAEVAPPPDHSVGQKVTPFTATTMDGKKIEFPASYRGKIVMIDFWATWCGPCMAEVPTLVAVHDELRAKGFEVLGISLDRENAADKIKKVTGEHGMTWPQVYDGKFWQAEIAELYVVKSIPSALLVDGDTGEILATTSMLRGERLVDTVEKALKKKGGRAG